MNTPHTPGPWIKEGGTVCQVDTLQTICKTSGKDEAAQSANAHLISAAPELLEALQFLLADWIAINGDRITGSRVPAEKAIAAIAKARGE
jgi:hypothetical protein